jgi:hypothetical protein
MEIGKVTDSFHHSLNSSLFQIELMSLWISESGDVTISKQQMKVCKILGFQGGDYEECRLLGCDAVCLL